MRIPVVAQRTVEMGVPLEELLSQRRHRDPQAQADAVAAGLQHDLGIFEQDLADDDLSPDRKAGLDPLLHLVARDLDPQQITRARPESDRGAGQQDRHADLHASSHAALPIPGG